VQSTSEKPSGPLQLRVYPGDDCRGSLYQDDGHTFAYQRGEFLRVHYSCQSASDSITVTSNPETSSFQPWWTTTEVTVFGAPTKPKQVHVADTASRNFHYDAKTRSVSVTVPDASKNWSVKISY
jgi:alpha-glucosidase